MYEINEAELNPKTLHSAAGSGTSVAHPGHPDVNQDSWLLEKVDANTIVAGVFDGLGGEAGGELASREAVKTVMKSLSDIEALGADWPREALNRGKTALRQLRQEARIYQMGTTAVLALVQGSELSIAWVGDSRIYGVYSDGRVEPLSEDHSLLNAKFNNGFLTQEHKDKIENILEEALDAEDFIAAGEDGKEAAAYFNQRNIVMGELGDGEISAKQVSASNLKALVLTSDGVHDNLRFSELVKICQDSKLSDLSQALVEASAQRSQSEHPRAKPDDITVVVVDLTSIK